MAQVRTYAEWQPANNDLAVDVCDGKYTFVILAGGQGTVVLRYGETWLTIGRGENAIYDLVVELAKAREALEEAQS